MWHRILRILPALLLAGALGAQAYNQIAFTSTADGMSNIYTMNPDGTAWRLLIADASDVAFTPDFSQLAFVRGRDIWVANPDGTRQRQVTRHDAGIVVHTPAFSATGLRLTFVMEAITPNAEPSIRVVNRDGTGEQTLATPGADPIYSPDAGIFLLFARGNTVQSMRLMRAEAPATEPIPLLSKINVTVRYPVLSRDGSRLVFCVTPNTPAAMTNIHIIDYAMDNHEVVLALNGSEPSFDPGGRFVAYASGGDIYRVEAIGGQPMRLTEGPAQDSHPVWWQPQGMAQFMP